MLSTKGDVLLDDWLQWQRLQALYRIWLYYEHA